MCVQFLIFVVILQTVTAHNGDLRCQISVMRFPLLFDTHTQTFVARTTTITMYKYMFMRVYGYDSKNQCLQTDLMSTPLR